MENYLDEYIKISDKLLKYLASSYTKKFRILGIEYNDLYQVGCLALVERYYDYDESRASFLTFSYLIIKSAMLKYICNNSTVTSVSTSLLHMMSNYNKKNDSFYLINGRTMTLEEKRDYLSDFKKLPLHDIDELIKLLDAINNCHYKSTTYSLEEKNIIFNDTVNTDPLIAIDDFVAQDYDLENTELSKLWIEQVLELVNECLCERDKEILIKKLGLYDNVSKTNRELALEYGISSQRIDQIYHNSIKKIKEHKKFTKLKLI